LWFAFYSFNSLLSSMRISSSSKSVLPATWTSVLERIQKALRQMIAAVGGRQEALDRAAEGTGAEHASNCQRLIEQLKPGDSTNAGSAEQVTEQVQSTTAALDSTEEALKRWLAAAGKAAQRLADQAGRRV
jgi:hypothetical protein